MNDDVGVHINHCCIIHGCKYGDEDCPVAYGTAKQAYPCWDCYDEWEVNKNTKCIAEYITEKTLNYLTNNNCKNGHFNTIPAHIEITTGCKLHCVECGALIFEVIKVKVTEERIEE